MKLRSLLIVSMILLSSCSTLKYTGAGLPLPTQIPQEQRLYTSELECVTQATFDKIVLLDKRRKTLRNIIETTRVD